MLLNRFKTCLLLFIIFVEMLSPPSLVYATTLPPDSSPSVDNINIFRHLLQSDDFFIIAKYNMPYASVPNASISQAYLFQLVNTEGTVLLTNEAYAWNDKGYGYGMVSFYASNTTAPAWGQSYKIRIMGKPSEFVSTANVTWNFLIPSSAYSTYTSQVDNQEALTNEIIDMASDLELAWTETLLDAGDTGTVLSSDGELYFRHSILGLQLMAPDLFLLQIKDSTYTSENWTGTQAQTYRTRFTGTWIGTATQAVADLFDMDFHFIASIPLVIGMVMCVIAGASQNNIYSGLMGSLGIALYGSLMGWIPMFIVAIGTFGIAAFMGYQWFLKGAS